MRTTVARHAAWLRAGVGVAVLLGLAEAATRALDPPFVPAASVVLVRVATLLTSTDFLGHVGATLRASLGGLAASTAVALPAGILLGSWSVANAASRALVELLRPIPSVALIPVAILLLGHGTQMRAALVAYAAAWPILFNTIYGLRSVDPIAKDTARSFGLGRAAILLRVTVPAAAPFVATGIRVATGIALIVAISAELLAGGRQGLGIWMLEAGSALRPDLVYAGTVVAGLLGLAVNAGLVALERRLLPWSPALREAG